MRTTPTHPLTDAVAAAERAHSSRADSLVREAQQLIRTLNQAIAAVEAGQHVGMFGVVHSQGSHIDMLCAEYQMTASHAQELRYLADQLEQAS